MFKLKTIESCNQYYRECKIMTFMSLYIFEIAVFVKRNFTRFQFLSDIIICNRRDYNKLSLRKAKTVRMRNSVFCMALIINNLLLVLNNKTFYNLKRNYVYC